jgi:ADP-ribose pyrophosphatase YjhB (NUDIX family)
MPTPDFILKLREEVGHDLLWLPGVAAVVFDEEGRVLLVRRSDNGRWTLVTGILEPGEKPSIGALREVMEETAVEAEIEWFVGAEQLPPHTLLNGDRVTCFCFTFRCRAIGGEAQVNDDESIEVGWFPLDGLPPMSDFHLVRLKTALGAAAGPRFLTGATPA